MGKLARKIRLVILLPHADAFDHRSDGYLKGVAISLLIGALAWILFLAWVPLKTPAKLAREEARDRKDAAELAAMGWSRSLFLPSRAFYGLPILLIINVLVFIAMVFSGLGVASFQSEDLIRWGANYGPLIQGFGMTRLITSQFVHAGLMHVAGNIYGLLFVSIFLMPVAMNARLIACYVVAGLGASIASVWMHPDIVSVGASGAVFGLCGVLAAMLLLRDPRLSTLPGAMLVNLAVYVGLNLVLGFVVPGIDNAAHIGGFVSGLIIGAVLYVMDRAWELPAEDDGDDSDRFAA
jgi:membrane associated rhomboid family serine protease